MAARTLACAESLLVLDGETVIYATHDQALLAHADEVLELGGPVH